MPPVKNNDSENKPVIPSVSILFKVSSKFTLVAKLCVVLAVLSCIVYANTIRNGYVLDDVMMITENHYVQQGFEGIPTLLTTHHLDGFGASPVSDNYRPLSLVMFAMEYSIFGLNAAEGHFLNVLFYAACVVLLFLFLTRLFNGERVVAAFVAALLFAVHPIHTEVVANIKSRDELLCFFFAFLSLLTFINYARQGKLYQLLTGALYLFFSILSKETAVIFLGIVPLVFFFYKNENRKRSILITICTVGVTVLFLGLWAYAQSRSAIQEPLGAKLIHSSASAHGTGMNLAPYILILGYHLKLLFVPYPLNFSYSFSNFAFARWGNTGVIISLALYVLLGFTGVYRLFKNKKDPWAFGILFYLVTLSLYSNIVFVLGQALANRYDFFPSVGFCLVLALAFERWVLKSTGNNIAILKTARSLVVLLPVLLCYSIMTVARNADWKDNFTLVNADISKSVDDYSMQYRAGLELQRKYDSEPDSSKQRQINEESIQHFLKSLAINPDYTEAHSDIGVAYMRVKEYDSAEFHFKRVLEMSPAHFNAAINLGTLFFEKGQFRDAIVYYRETIGIDSNADIAWYNMGICYARIQQLDSSMRCIKKVIEIAPQLDNYKSYGNAAILFKMMGEMDSARKYEHIMQQYFPGFAL